MSFGSLAHRPVVIVGHDGSVDNLFQSTFSADLAGADGEMLEIPILLSNRRVMIVRQDQDWLKARVFKGTKPVGPRRTIIRLTSSMGDWADGWFSLNTKLGWTTRRGREVFLAVLRETYDCCDEVEPVYARYFR